MSLTFLLTFILMDTVVKKISHKLLLPLGFIFVNMTVNYKSLYDDILLEVILLDGRISRQEPLSLFPVVIDSTLRTQTERNKILSHNFKHLVLRKLGKSITVWCSVAQRWQHWAVGVKWAAESATADLYLMKADPEVLGPQSRPKVRISTTQSRGCPRVDPDLIPIEHICGEKNLSVDWSLKLVFVTSYLYFPLEPCNHS